jgi:photosystem II stability/assembly factor-like uncharacterized protein
MKHILFTFSVLLLWICGLTQASFANWTALPLDYEHPAFVCADSSGSRLWIVGQGQYRWYSSYSLDGRFWTSYDNGQHWWNAEDNQWSIYGDYRRLHLYPPIDPAGDTLLVRFVPYSQIYPEYWTSFNGGRSWTMLSSISYRSIIISPTNRNIWLIPAGYRTFHQSTNAGATWDSLAGALPFNGSFTFDPLRDSTFYTFDGTVADTNHGVCQSDDYGIHWTQILNPASLFPGQAIQISRFYRLSYGTMLATIVIDHSTHLYFSDNNGQGWSEMTGIPASFQWMYNSTIIEDNSEPGNLFISGLVNGGLIRSFDYGRNWYPCTEGLPDQIDSVRTFYRQPYSGDLYVAFKNLGLFRSTDHGYNWQPVSLPPVTHDTPFYGFFEQGVTLTEDVFADSAWLMTNSDSHWRLLSTSRPDTYATEEFVSPLIRMNDDTLMRIECAVNSNLTLETRMFRSISTDRGQSWQYHQISNPDSTSFPSYIRLVRNEPVTLLAHMESYQYDNFLWLTDDLGNSWRHLNVPPGYSEVIPDYVWGDTAIYLWDIEAGIWATSDEGQHWSHLISDSNYISSSLSLINGTDLYVGCRQNLLRWNGMQWDTLGILPGDYNESYNQIVGVPDLQIMLLVHTAYRPQYNALFYSSADDGVTWNQLNIAMPDAVVLNHIESRPQYDPYRHRIWITTTNGTCYIETSELTGTSSDRTIHFKPADFTVLSAYPNPFNGSTRIRYDLDRQSKVQLQIFDLQGRLVTTLLDDISEPGQHELLWNADNLSSGTYFVRLQTPQSIRTEKLLLLK